jgi:hypothetical protein
VAERRGDHPPPPRAGKSQPAAIPLSVFEGPSISCSPSSPSWLAAVCALALQIEEEAQERSGALKEQAVNPLLSFGQKILVFGMSRWRVGLGAW